jgi:hypothetical protein
MGCDPTGRVIQFKCIEIIRIDNGRIAERWGEWNPVELLEQLRSQKRRSQRRADSKTRSRLGSSQSDSPSSGNANLRRILVNGEGASVSSGGSETPPPDIFFAASQRTKFLRYVGVDRENFRKSDGK